MKRKKSGIDMTEEELRDIYPLLDWEAVSRRQELTDNFIREFRDEVDWFSIITDYKHNIKFVRENLKYIDRYAWIEISMCRDLTPEFIYTFSEYLDWSSIPARQDKSKWSKEDKRKIREMKRAKMR